METVDVAILGGTGADIVATESMLALAAKGVPHGA